MKKKYLVVANWKMNPKDRDDAKSLFKASKLYATKIRKIETVICPPFVYLADFPKKSKIIMGAQDVFWKSEGAFTGEIGTSMLKTLGVSYVIIGHSERRALGETDEIVAKKVSAALASNIKPIICVGESERDENGLYLNGLRSSIIESLKSVRRADVLDIVIAYEPVWAIGGPDALDARGVHETTLFIRKCIGEIWSKDIAITIPILYGGSVNGSNAGEIVKNGEVQGLLVGRSSLDKQSFKEILQSVDSI